MTNACLDCSRRRDCEAIRSRPQPEIVSKTLPQDGSLLKLAHEPGFEVSPMGGDGTVQLRLLLATST
jgi:hypothetical protein